MDIYSELKQLVKSINKRRIPCALCGGLAMAIHGVPRATIDIDLMVEEGSLAEVKEIAGRMGFSHSPRKMEFKDGAIKIHRLVKFDQEKGDELMLDLLIVTSSIQDVWESREHRVLDWGELSVVSREGLIKLKELRGSGTDKDDVKRLRGEVDEG